VEVTVPAPVITFFNNKSGVGRTSLAFHVSWMASELGLRVLVADFDPQSDLTSGLLPDDELQALWPADDVGDTVYGALRPLIHGVGDIAPKSPIPVGERRFLLPGDLSLARFEDQLSETWPNCLSGDERAFRVTSALWRLLVAGADEVAADVVIVDVGPNLGALNRSALVATDHVVIPLAPDLFSGQGLRNLGPALHEWRSGWAERLAKRPGTQDLALPAAAMAPEGYVLLGLGRSASGYRQWTDRIPPVYLHDVLGDDGRPAAGVDVDPHCLGQIKHYRSLMPMAQEAGKPVFALTAADGAFGGHQKAVSQAYDDFRILTTKILDAASVELGT
jgi:chromosome partitioning protein